MTAQPGSENRACTARKKGLAMLLLSAAREREASYDARLSLPTYRLDSEGTVERQPYGFKRQRRLGQLCNTKHGHLFGTGRTPPSILSNILGQYLHKQTGGSLSQF